MGNQRPMSLPADNFYAFKDSIEVYAFMKGPIEYCNRARRSFLLKLTIKVRDKIVADGLVDKTFDVTNIGIHLKAKEFNELLEDPNTIVVDMRNLRERLVIYKRN
jgi:UPF0176 protein